MVPTQGQLGRWTAAHFAHLMKRVLPTRIPFRVLTFTHSKEFVAKNVQPIRKVHSTNYNTRKWPILLTMTMISDRLVRKVALHRENRSCQTVIKTWSCASDGAWHQEGLIDWLTVCRNVTLTLTNIEKRVCKMKIFSSSYLTRVECDGAAVMLAQKHGVTNLLRD
jgi:hypothetical protein